MAAIGTTAQIPHSSACGSYITRSFGQRKKKQEHAKRTESIHGDNWYTYLTSFECLLTTNHPQSPDDVPEVIYEPSLVAP